MPLYEGEEVTRDDLEKIRRTGRCQVCGARLNIYLDPGSGKAFVACWDWLRTHHEGIEREVIPYEVNIPTRREFMEQEYGPGKATALARYIGVGVITKRIATEIVETLWGEAPPIEKTKAILLCQTYQLNPLMKHIYLVGYKRKDKDGEYIVDGQGKEVMDWSLQIGIGATRLMAQRKHNYSYLDMTPRKATKEEIDKILGDTADKDNIYGFVHIKDIKTGAEAFGLRGIPKNERVKGQEKGNTPLNMACIRAERLALDRQYPGEMPQGLEVVDERYIDPEYTVTDEPQGGGEQATISTEGDEKPGAPPAEPEAQIEGEGFSINLAWLNESLKELKWSQDTCRGFLVSHYKVSPQGTLEDVLKRLTREQAEEFVKELQGRVEKHQPGLFD